jgi:nickel/cobalt transporter (NicO) family protein
VMTDRSVLLITAASVAILHTIMGPDHYFPFAMMARAGRWSKTKTAAITLICGLGHVLSSVALGAVGIALGMVVSRILGLESFRDRLAGWFLIAFGLAYFAWGVQRAKRQRPHSHLHLHADGTAHAHTHVHELEHSHAHGVDAGATASPAAQLTPWILFSVFITGPCKPLIPLLMFPAAQKSLAGMILVIVVFGAATVSTMLLTVLACLTGLERLPLGHLERYAHAFAGAAIAMCGVAIRSLSL